MERTKTTPVRPDDGPAAITARAGKYLTFQLDAEHYGLQILKVQEIIGMLPITRIPHTPSFIRGVVNLRGRIVPVIDLRLRFGMQTREYTDRTCIIVVQLLQGTRNLVMGVIVDRVSEVVDIGAAQIEAAPSFGMQVEIEFIQGMGKLDQDRVVTLLDIDQVLSQSEIRQVDKAARAGESRGRAGAGSDG